MKSLLFVCLIAFSFQAQAQWKNNTPYSSSLRDITFVDQNHGFACGQSGSIGNCQLTYNFFKTNDGGRNWIRMRTGTTNQPLALHFNDKNTGWLLCTSSEVLKTTDGGMTWTQQTSGIGSGLNDIWFVNDQNGFVVGNNGLLRRSFNGGASWQTISSGTGSSLRRIHFSSTSNGVISVSGGNILHTSDGGNDWDEIDVGAAAINDFHFISEQNGYAVGFADGAGNLFTTTNGGASWTAQLIGDFTPLRVFFLDEQTGFIVSDGQGIYKTFDGGESWTNYPTMNGTSDAWTGIYFTTEQQGYLCGNLGKVMKTTDSGQNWVSQHCGFSSQVNSVSAVHRDTIYLGDNNGRLYKSVNAGVNTRQLIPVQGDAVQKIIAFDEQNIVSAYSQKILRSSNGGESWEEKFSNASLFITDMHFPSSEVGYISTLDSLLLKTIDGGENWATINPDLDDYFRSVWFTDEETGYLLSDDYVYKTEDGGENWTSFWLDQFPLSITGLNDDIVFSSDSIGYLINSQKVFWTRNAGLTWEERSGTGGNTINELYMVNDSLGFFTRNTSQGMTIDSCLNMSSASTACLANNWSMHGIDMTDGGDYGYSVGGLGGLMHSREQREILTPFLSGDAYCSGSEIYVGFVGKGLYFSESIYTVQLSDAEGDFSSAQDIGSADMSGSSVYQSSIALCQLPSGLSGDGYRVRVVHSSGETISPDNGFDIQIDSSIMPTASIMGSTPSGICPGDAVQVLSTTSGGGDDPQYVWKVNGVTTFSGTDSFTSEELLEGDEVTLELTSSLGCASPETILSNSYVVSTSPEIITGLPEDLDLCSGESTQLNGSEEYDYEWEASDGLSSTNVPNPVVNFENATVLQYTATDENGCTKSDSINVFTSPLPEILSPDTILCSGQSFQLQATPGGEYLWSPAGLFDDSSIANPIATVSEESQIICEIISAEGCQKVDSLTISVDTPIGISSIASSICGGSSIQLFAESGASYSWSPAESLSDTEIADPIATPTENTSYFLNIQSELGCNYTDSVIISIFEPVSVTFENDTLICPGTCLQLNPQFSAPIQNAIWGPNESLSDVDVIDPIACPDLSNIYDLDFQDENGCFNSSSFTLFVADDPELPGIAFNAPFLNSTEASTYQWLLNGELIEGANEQDYIPQENGFYSVIVTDENGCEATSEELEVIVVGLHQQLIHESWALFLNSNRLTLISPKMTYNNLKVQVLDLSGRLVYVDQSSLRSANNTIEIYTSTWSPGVYIIQVMTTDQLLYKEKFWVN